MDFGLVGYRPFGPTDSAVWEATYAAGKWAYMAELVEAPRYAALIAYMTALHPKPPAVLDVGCGPGLFRSRIGGLPLERYVGIDPSATAIAQAKNLEDNLTRFIVATEPTADLGDFDVVVCSEMLYYLWDLDRFFDRANSALRPGGHLLCSIWQHPGVTALQRRLDARFPPVAIVELSTQAGRSRRWRVSGHRRLED
jgi:2-polyprenyl-6-hydroxyphenyl methylase/3-demethylubiquinone-9 3-methyltransferase